MFETCSRITDLQSQWRDMADPDRAAAILAIQQAGTSIRTLAKSLDCSESHLRNLLLAGEALPEDIALARRGEITTRELVRRSKAAAARRMANDAEACELRRAKQTASGAKKIIAWLAAEGLSGSSAQQAVEEARWQIGLATTTGKLPPSVAPARMSLAEIILRSRPKNPITDDINYMAWYAAWLMRWTFYAMPDANVRDHALDAALKKLPKR